MTGPAWDVFAGIVGFVTVAIVVLARLSAGLVTDGLPAGGDAADETADGLADEVVDGPTDEMADGPADGAVNEAGRAADETAEVTDGVVTREDGAAAGADDAITDAVGHETATGDDRAGTDESPMTAGESMPPGALLANVALSQGLFGSLLVVGAWFTRVPASALGLGDGAAAGSALALGAGLGVVLYAGNEVLAAAASRAGVAYSEALRELLAPESTLGWVVLLGVALPVVAGFEELLFRGALVGALSVGFGVSPWLLAVASSLLFGVAHGAQGPAGMVVTGALGFALAAAFVLTGSLAVVVVAHYLVNVLEFAVHEGLDVEWA